MNPLGHKRFALVPKQRRFLPRDWHVPLYSRIPHITLTNPKQFWLCIDRAYLIKLIVILSLPKLGFFFQRLRTDQIFQFFLQRKIFFSNKFEGIFGLNIFLALELIVIPQGTFDTLFLFGPFFQLFPGLGQLWLDFLNIFFISRIEVLIYFPFLFRALQGIADPISLT
jgi:hypothetical protein